MMRRMGALIVGLFVVLGMASPAPGAQPGDGGRKPTELTFSLEFIPLGRFAPWYVALAKGYYEAEGLNVKIIHGTGTAQVIQAVESGLAHIGFIDVPALVIARSSASSTIRMVAVNYQKPPYAVFSLDPGANVQKPKDLEGVELGSGAGSFMPRVLAAFMKMHGLNPDTLKVRNIEPAARVAMLTSAKVQTIDLFIMTEPTIARAAPNSKVRTLFLGDYGLDIYSNGIGAKEDYIRKNPDTMRAFVRASLRGWKDSMANPGEAAELMRRYHKTLAADIIVEELKILSRLAVVPDTQTNGYGWFSREKMKATLDFVATNLELKGKPPAAEDLYLTGFLPTPPIMP